MFELARGYRAEGMTAYVELQQREFASEEVGYTATRHQREVGAGYFDLVAQAVTGGESSTLALKGSTRRRSSRRAPGLRARRGDTGSAPRTRSEVRRSDGSDAVEARSRERFTRVVLLLDRVRARTSLGRGVSDSRYNARPCSSTTRSPAAKEELPSPPGPIRMYVCGPTVYQRIHVGNARPFVVFLWLKRWLRGAGLRGHARRERHRRQRQDLRGRVEAGDRERRARRRGDALVRRGHRRARPRPARPRAARERDDPRDRRADRGARRPRPRLRVARATSTSAWRATRTTAQLSGAKLEDMVAAGAERPEGGPARLRALEGDEAARGHVVALALGPRPPGLAHRVLGDGREAARPGVRDPRRRARPALPAPRERARPVARRRPRVRAALGAQRHARARRRRRCRSRSGTSSRCARRWTTYGREAILAPLPAAPTTAARWSTRTRRWTSARRQAETLPEHFRIRSQAGRRRPSAGSDFVAALDDDFNTPAALALLHDWRARGRARASCDAALDVFGLGDLARAPKPRPRSSSSRDRRAARPDERDFAEADRLRAEIDAARLARSATPPDGFDLVPARVDPRARLRPPAGAGGRARREAAGPRAARHRARARRRAVAPRASRAAAPGRPGAAAQRRRRHERPPGRRRLLRAVPLRRRARPRRRASGRSSSASTRSPIRTTSAPSSAAPRARARAGSSSPSGTRRGSRRPCARPPREPSSTCRSPWS